MTVSLVTPAAPAGPGVKGRGTTSGDPSSAQGFGRVMAQQLAASGEEAAAGRTGKAGTTAATGENARESEGSDGGAEGGSTDVLPHLVLVGTPSGFARPQGGSGTGHGFEDAPAGTGEESADAVEGGGSPVVATAVLHGTAVPAATTPLGESGQQNATGAPASTSAAGAAAAATGQPATGAAPSGAAPTSAPQTGDGDAATGAGSVSPATGSPVPAGMDPAPSGSVASTAASEQPAATAGLGATAPAGVPTAPAAAAASNGSPVTSQVFPTIPALVSRGEGTHSITLRLHPADLGEVHVTVTVKNGVVDVTLAAGREAQEAVRSGSNELRSILDLAGGATGQLTVRDLPTGPAPTGSASTSAFSLPSSSADTQGEPSGSTGERSSEDGPHGREGRGTADRDQAASEPTETSNARSAAGLDLTL